MRALVTGGAGFIGSALVDRLLAEGHRVDVVDNLSGATLANLADARRVGGRDLSVHQVDVRSTELAEVVGRRRPDVVFHLAGQGSPAASVERPALDADINVVGSLNTFEAARAAGCRKVVVASSASAVYGDVEAGQPPLTERHPRQPRSPHGVAKHAVDAYLVAFRELHGVEFTSLVLGTVYGPRDARGVVGAWVRAMVSGQPCVMVGDGNQTRDFVYVDDVVDALARAATRADGLLLNVGTGIETSLTQLYGLLARAVQTGGGLSVTAAPVHHPPCPAEARRTRLDATRAGIYLDWKPWTALEQGLAAVVAAELAGPRRPDDPATS